jgi:dynein heavy chain 2
MMLSANPLHHCNTAVLQAAGKVVSFAELSGVLARLSAMAAQLDACQRALAEFLEEKRAAFPRCAT